MKCFVDAGNSRIKWRFGPEGEVHSCDWQALDDWPDKLVASVDGQEPQRIVIASVVEPARAEALGDHLEDVWPGVARQWLKVPARGGALTIGYREPKQLGIDRYCAMLAAHTQRGDENLIVVHVGTALTLDAVRADGRHEGGVIMPGFSAMLSGLAMRAPVLLPATEAVRSEGLLPNHKDKKGDQGSLLATDTQSAIALGCHWMLVATLQSALVAVRSELSVAEDGDVTVLLTGGDAERLRALLASAGSDDVVLAPELVLDGAILLAKRQR